MAIKNLTMERVDRLDTALQVLRRTKEEAKTAADECRDKLRALRDSLATVIALDHECQKAQKVIEVVDAALRLRNGMDIGFIVFGTDEAVQESWRRNSL